MQKDLAVKRVQLVEKFEDHLLNFLQILNEN